MSNDDFTVLVGSLIGGYALAGVSFTLRDLSESPGSKPGWVYRATGPKAAMVTATWPVRHFVMLAFQPKDLGRVIAFGVMMTALVWAAAAGQVWLCIWAAREVFDNLLLQLVAGGVAFFLIALFVMPIVTLLSMPVQLALALLVEGLLRLRVWRWRHSEEAQLNDHLPVATRGANALNRVGVAGRRAQRLHGHSDESRAGAVADELLSRHSDWFRESDHTTLIRGFASAWLTTLEHRATEGGQSDDLLAVVESHFAAAAFQRLSPAQRVEWGHLVLRFVEIRAAPSSKLVPALEDSTRYVALLCEEVLQRAPHLRLARVALRACQQRLGTVEADYR